MNTNASADAATTPAAGALPHYGTTERVTKIRKIIASRMVESLQTSAQLTATVEVDLSAVSDIRREKKDAFRAAEGVGLSYLPFIMHATAAALKEYPKLNATIDLEAGTITYADGEHFGLAVDTARGLLVPVIRAAGELTVGGLAKAIGDLASRAQNNELTMHDLDGGSFTVTNYGSVGTLMDTPIINQPQVAILGTGALTRRPAVVKAADGTESIEARDLMYLSLSYDHRLVDGADAARFLTRVKSLLEAADFEV